MNLHLQFYASSGDEYRSLISSLHLYFSVYNFIIEYTSLFYSYTYIDKQIDRYSQCVELQDSSQYLDMVIISHFHSDHINGLPLLFKKFKIKN
ncbi:MBL fold metallo-hydrolase [Acidithiobacillus ferrooxidans]|uniref:Metallo-beta-lactamase domain-containing protein n=1 Tax=Acidithiobacillus ferrooxidans TaxID=920 RepID=A0A2W1KI31_ACIFR|nr:hypothetical protein DN052_03390 [Acidithiobacillus ferrooxidans]QLK41620.1 MBL fold metallo-hydrolase [Acidithiobacillus ferrooxidans]RRN85684.1 MAG: MBL fold metallo-hydrolase [Acidithiobacillus ferrooxidans]